MNKDHTPTKYDPTTQRPGYLTHDRGFVPSHAERGRNPSWSAADEREHHLHRHYRKRIRNVRMRWFGSGLALGALAGIALVLFASTLVVTQFPEVLRGVTGEPDVVVVLGEGFLNREAANKLKQPYATGIGSLQLTSVNMDLQPGNRMDLQPTFTMQVFTTINISPAVKNELEVQDGKLVLKMVGDPQIGNLNLPLEFLPFDLKSQLRQAIDKVNNDLLISEINQSLASSYGSSQFTIMDVSTTDTGMTVKMRTGP
ncbi:MAG: hypothetical protein ACJ78Q_20135 [Chloroflexia bacterium]